jgi:hypothetical protein
MHCWGGHGPLGRMYGQISTLACRHRGAPGRGAGAHHAGPDRPRHRRAARQGGGRKPRARAPRVARRRPRYALLPRDREPRARGPAQGRQPVRLADRARHDGRHGGDRARRIHPNRAHLPGGMRLGGHFGPARTSTSSRRRICSRSSTTSRAISCSHGPSPSSIATRPRFPTCATSKARRAPSACLRSPPPAGTTF